jgi:hypothetical protein
MGQVGEVLVNVSDIWLEKRLPHRKKSSQIRVIFFTKFQFVFIFLVKDHPK